MPSDWTTRTTIIVAVLAAFLAGVSPYLGNYWAPLDLLAQFLLQAAVATTLLLLVLTWTRRLKSAAAAAIAIAVQLWTLAPFTGLAVGDAMASPPRPATLRVVFFNVWHYNDRFDTIAAWLAEVHPDIVVLAEVGRYSEPLLDLVEAELPNRLDCTERGGCDMAVFAREPFSMRHLPGRDGGTHVMEARIAFGSSQLRLLATHLTRPVGVGTLDRQLAQAQAIAKQVAAEPLPTLVMGDLNAVPWAAVVDALRSGTGLHPVPTLEGTWPAFLPWPLRIPIDNALHTAGVDVTAMRIGPFLGSDHRPIILDLAPSDRASAQRATSPASPERS